MKSVYARYDSALQSLTSSDLRSSSPDKSVAERWAFHAASRRPASEPVTASRPRDFVVERPPRCKRQPPTFVPRTPAMAPLSDRVAAITTTYATALLPLIPSPSVRPGSKVGAFSREAIEELKEFELFTKNTEAGQVVSRLLEQTKRHHDRAVVSGEIKEGPARLRVSVSPRKSRARSPSPPRARLLDPSRPLRRGPIPTAVPMRLPSIQASASVPSHYQDAQSRMSRSASRTSVARGRSPSKRAPVKKPAPPEPPPALAGANSDSSESASDDSSDALFEPSLVESARLDDTPRSAPSAPRDYRVSPRASAPASEQGSSPRVSSPRRGAPNSTPVPAPGEFDGAAGTLPPSHAAGSARPESAAADTPTVQNLSLDAELRGGITSDHDSLAIEHFPLDGAALRSSSADLPQDVWIPDGDRTPRPAAATEEGPGSALATAPDEAEQTASSYAVAELLRSDADVFSAAPAFDWTDAAIAPAHPPTPDAPVNENDDALSVDDLPLSRSSSFRAQSVGSPVTLSTSSSLAVFPVLGDEALLLSARREDRVDSAHTDANATAVSRERVADSEVPSSQYDPTSLGDFSVGDPGGGGGADVADRSSVNSAPPTDAGRPSDVETGDVDGVLPGRSASVDSSERHFEVGLAPSYDRARAVAPIAASAEERAALASGDSLPAGRDASRVDAGLPAALTTFDTPVDPREQPSPHAGASIGPDAGGATGAAGSSLRDDLSSSIDAADPPSVEGTAAPADAQFSPGDDAPAAAGAAQITRRSSSFVSSSADGASLRDSVRRIG